jgi:hypothetical protein
MDGVNSNNGANNHFNDDNFNSIQCFRCRSFGHKAKDCNNYMNENNRRQKTVSTSNMNEVTVKCFKCSQIGHFARDCRDDMIIKNSNYQQHSVATFHKSNANGGGNSKYANQQQSTPQVKIVTFINPSNSSTAPILIQSGDNYQLVVNKNAIDTNNGSKVSGNGGNSGNNNAGKQLNQANANSPQANKTNHPLFHQQQMQAALLQRQQSNPVQFQKQSNVSFYSALFLFVSH